MNIKRLQITALRAGVFDRPASARTFARLRGHLDEINRTTQLRCVLDGDALVRIVYDVEGFPAARVVYENDGAQETSRYQRAHLELATARVDRERERMDIGFDRAAYQEALRSMQNKVRMYAEEQALRLMASAQQEAIVAMREMALRTADFLEREPGLPR